MEWSEETVATYFEQMKAVTDFYIDMKLKKKHIRLTIFERGTFEEEKAKYKNAWGCGAGRGRICVGVDGSLYGCSKLMTITEQHNALLPLGSLDKGWDNLYHRYLLNDNSLKSRQSCKSCELADECTGGCPATNWESTKNIYNCGRWHKTFVGIYQEIGKYFSDRWEERTGKLPTNEDILNNNECSEIE